MNGKCYDNTGHCGCFKHSTKRRYHWHRVFDDGEIDCVPFGKVGMASISGMAYETRKITHYFKVDTVAGKVEECGFCKC